MKPRILIAMHYMHLGGAEMSLIGLLQALKPEKVNIDLFVYSHEGELITHIPKYVNLLPEIKSYSMFERPMVELLKKGHWDILAARLWSKFKTKQYMKHTQPTKECAVGMGYLGKYVSKVVPDINPTVEYDLAISFLTPHNFVQEHVRAKKKICWIHTDYTRIDVNVNLEVSVWGKYDHIISISQGCTKSFLHKFPSLKDKILEMENILPKQLIEKKAEQKLKDNSWLLYSSSCSNQEEITLLSIGRFYEAKNYDNVPNICKQILESGCNIKWYIIGYGIDEGLILQRIAEARMQSHVIILGKKDNPYPYIKACDIYVQPSRYEGKSIVVREAQMLCKPVVVTNYPTASSQIQNGKDGIIVPMDNEGCAKGIVEFIHNKQQQEKIKKYLISHDNSGITEVEIIYNLLNKK